MEIIFPLIILGLGLFLFYGMGWSNLKALAPYRPLPMGTMASSGRKVYVEGVYGPGKILQSPIAQESCVSWRVVVWEKEGRNYVTRLDQGSYLEEDFCILRRGDRRRFAIEQQSILRSIGDLAGVKGSHHQYQQNLFWQSKYPQAVTFLEANGLTSHNRLGMRRSLTITESFWCTGDRVYVLGELQQRQGEWWLIAHLLSDQTMEQLRFVPSIFMLVGGIMCVFGFTGLFTPLR